MELAPYPEYKDSGVPWLGKIPVCWDCLPHRAIFSEIKEQGHINEPLLSVTITKGIIPQSQLLATTSKKDSSNLDKSKYKLVCPDDIAYNKMRAWQGAIGVSRYRGIISPAYIVVRLRKIGDPNFFHYLLRTPSFAKEAERWSYGITPDMWSLRPEHFKLICSCVPSVNEQVQITRFLDWKTSQINKFIRNKRRFIELLKEQKQNIINQAVTRGLDPKVKLKPSGVEWIGDIPEHWEARRLRTLAAVRASGVDKNTNEDEVPVMLCNYVDVYKNDRITAAIDFMKATATPEEIRAFALKSGDVIITKDSESWDDIAIPTFVPEALPGIVCAYHLALIRPFSGEIEGEFLFRAFSSDPVADQFRIAATGVTRFGLAQGAIKGAFFPLPPLEEQRAIIAHINEKCAEISQAISRAEREIELMREYRTRLISDVVTGQVDVRGIEVPDVAEDELLALEEDTIDADDVIDDEGEMDETD